MGSDAPKLGHPVLAKGHADLTPEDRALLERVASRIVELRLEVPAILTLETGRPLSVLAGQTMHFFEPMIGAFLAIQDYRRFALMIERRETIEVLLRLIESHAETAHAQRKAEAAARKAERKSRRSIGQPRNPKPQ